LTCNQSRRKLFTVLNDLQNSLHSKRQTNDNEKKLRQHSSLCTTEVSC
jgi:hypothetical protein